MKELVVGKATEKDMRDVQLFANQKAMLQSQRASIDEALIQHGVQLRDWFNGLEKRHKLEHGHTYRVLPNGDIVKIIPDPPPIAGDNHQEELKKEEVN